MGVKVNQVTTFIPWQGLRSFVWGYGDLFLPNTKTQFRMDVSKEPWNSDDTQKVKLTFAYPGKSNGIKIYGLTKSKIGIVSEMKLDLEDAKGRITLPQFGTSIELNEKGDKVFVPSNWHPDIRTFTEDALRFFQIVLNSFLNINENVVRETLGKMLMEYYPHRYN